MPRRWGPGNRAEHRQIECSTRHHQKNMTPPLLTYVNVFSHYFSKRLIFLRVFVVFCAGINPTSKPKSWLLPASSRRLCSASFCAKRAFILCLRTPPPARHCRIFHSRTLWEPGYEVRRSALSDLFLGGLIQNVKLALRGNKQCCCASLPPDIQRTKQTVRAGFSAKNRWTAYRPPVSPPLARQLQ